MRWLCERVGGDGHVVATDIDTRFLEEVDALNLEVRRHDIASEDLEEGAFDLVHSRFVLEHLPEREHALRRMVAALKPGGWALIEDVDFLLPVTTSAEHVFVIPRSSAALVAKVRRATAEMMRGVGIDPEYGRRLPEHLLAEGLEDIAAEGSMGLIWGGSMQARIGRLSMEQLGPKIVDAGLLTEEDLDQMRSLLDDPTTAGMSPVLVSAWGRRPGTGE